MITTLSTAKPQARKAHRCSLCGRTIRPGETYERQHNFYEDNLYTWKSCAHCVAFMALPTSAQDDVYCREEGWTTDAMWEWRPATIWEARLRAQFRRKWQRLDGDLYPIPTTPAVAA